MSGIVYCLVNQAMPDYVKIGKTGNLEERLRSLDNTSMPLSVECVFALEMEEPDKQDRAAAPPDLSRSAHEEHARVL